MRILIVGAGATGGSYGTLLLEAGRDVTFLVRPQRAEVLRRDGLRFVTPEADRTHQVQPLISGEEAAPFDLVLLTVKATALESAIADMRSYIGPRTRIVPILNGMAHIPRLELEFPGQVLGGLAKIVATLDGGAVHQMTGLTALTIGMLDGSQMPSEIVQVLDVPGIDLTVSDDVTAALWEKWAFIAAAGVITCLFRGPVGAIIEAGGLARINDAIDEMEEVAAAAGYPVSERGHRHSLDLLTAPGSAFTSSLYRDLTAGFPHEGEHILGAMVERARQLDVQTPLLDLTVIQVRTGAIAKARY